MNRAGVALLLILSATPAAAEPVAPSARPPVSSTLSPPISPSMSPDIAAELGRLEGHRVEVASGGAVYRILDVAGEGAPTVGVVERRGAELWLRSESGSYRLIGPVAHPRMAGPGYKIWVLGRIRSDGSLMARRLGVLTPPRSGAANTRRAARR